MITYLFHAAMQGDMDAFETAAAIQNMDHDELVEKLKNLDSDLVASYLEDMDPKSLAQLLALYYAGTGKEETKVGYAYKADKSAAYSQAMLMALDTDGAVTSKRAYGYKAGEADRKEGEDKAFIAYKAEDDEMSEAKTRGYGKAPAMISQVDNTYAKDSDVDKAYAKETKYYGYP